PASWAPSRAMVRAWRVWLPRRRLPQMPPTTIGGSVRIVGFVGVMSIEAFPPGHGETALSPAPPTSALPGPGPRVHLESDGFDGFDVPAVGEGVVQLLPRHLGDDVARLIGTAAHEEQPAARLDHPRQPPDVAPAVVVGEDVEQAGVDDACKPL